jgi:hypothetical protein
MGHLDPPGVTDRAKYLGAVFVVRWLVPSDSSDLVVEPCRQSLSSGLGGAPVHEHEFEPLVGARSREVFEKYLDRFGF